MLQVCNIYTYIYDKFSKGNRGIFQRKYPKHRQGYNRRQFNSPGVLQNNTRPILFELKLEQL